MILAAALLAGTFAAQLGGVESATRRSIPADESVLDTVVASLEPEDDPSPRFVLRSDYVLRLRTELATRGAPNALHVRVDDTVSAAVLEQLMAEFVVTREAQRAELDGVDAEELGAARARIVARLGDVGGTEALLRETGASAAEFDALLRRQVVCERYLLSRHPELLEPADDEVREALEADRFAAVVPAGATPADSRARVRAELVHRALPRALRQYLRGLGSRVRVRRFHDE